MICNHIDDTIDTLITIGKYLCKLQLKVNKPFLRHPPSFLHLHDMSLISPFAFPRHCQGHDNVYADIRGENAGVYRCECEKARSSSAAKM